MEKRVRIQPSSSSRSMVSGWKEIKQHFPGMQWVEYLSCCCWRQWKSGKKPYRKVCVQDRNGFYIYLKISAVEKHKQCLWVVDARPFEWCDYARINTQEGRQQCANEGMVEAMATNNGWVVFMGHSEWKRIVGYKCRLGDLDSDYFRFYLRCGFGKRTDLSCNFKMKDVCNTFLGFDFIL